MTAHTADRAAAIYEAFHLLETGLEAPPMVHEALVASVDLLPSTGIPSGSLAHLPSRRGGR